MKKILTILFLLAATVSYSQTKLVAALVRNSPTDTSYAPLTDTLLNGSLQVVYNKTSRNAIPFANRKNGMLVITSVDDSTFQLQGGITNSNWVALSLNGTTYAAGYGINILGTTISADTSKVSTIAQARRLADSAAGAITTPNLQSVTNVGNTTTTNIFANNVNSNLTVVTATNGTTTLTSSSSRIQDLTGVSSQSFQLPNATTLVNGFIFEFNNNASGTLTVVDNGSNTISTIPKGGYAYILLTNNTTTNGSWDKHFTMPSNASYGTNGMTITGTLSTTGLDTYSSNLGSSYTSRTKVDKNYVDSSNALNVKYADTSSMLSPYARDYNVVHISGSEYITGTKTFTNHFALQNIGTSYFNTRSTGFNSVWYQNKAYTVGDSADIAARVMYTDTSSMLSPYLRSTTAAGTYAPISGSANYIQNGTSQQASSNFNISGSGVIGNGLTLQRLNATSAIFNKDSIPRTTTNVWLATIDTVTGRLQRINSSAFGTGTVTSVATNTGSGITGGTITTTGTIAADTSVLSTKANVTASLLPKLNLSDTASMLANRLKISDTASMLSPYRRTSTKITNSDLANSTISGVSLGSNLNALSNGYGITTLSYNGSATGSVIVDSTKLLPRADSNIAVGYITPTFLNSKGYGTGSVTSVATGYGLSGGNITTTGTLIADSTALSSKLNVLNQLNKYTGSSNIVTVGTITTGVWNATAIADTYIASASTWNGKQAALSGTGFVKISGTTISYDNSTYLTANQTITLSGDVSGSGTTAITTTIGALKVTNAMLAGSIDYAKMNSGTVPTWNQNTTGTASNITATTNSTLVTASALTTAAGGAFGSNAYTSTAYLPLAGGTLTGALSGTSASFSNTSGSVVVIGTTASPSQLHYDFKNSLNTGEVGLFANGNAYLASNGAYPLVFYTNGVLRQTIDGSTGAATFAGALNGTNINLSSSISFAGSSIPSTTGNNQMIVANTAYYQAVVAVQNSFANNAYYTGSNWVIGTSATVLPTAVRLINDGHIQFHVAPAGTAGSTLTNWDGSNIAFTINPDKTATFGSSVTASSLNSQNAFIIYPSSSSAQTVMKLGGGNYSSTVYGANFFFTTGAFSSANGNRGVRFTINSSSNTEIQTTDGAGTDATDVSLKLQPSGGATTIGGTLGVTGYLTASGGAGTSDLRVKNVLDYDTKTSILPLLHLREYQFKDIDSLGFKKAGDEVRWGFATDDVKKQYPSLIRNLGSNTTTEALNYQDLTNMALIELRDGKADKNEVERLKQRISELEKHIK